MELHQNDKRAQNCVTLPTPVGTTIIKKDIVSASKDVEKGNACALQVGM